ncbi:MAG: hypothetical protein NVS3B13_39060 [Mucilaginibacter sp.]
MMSHSFFGMTDTGKERIANEDTFLTQKSANGDYIIACVIDGVGGYHGGEIAAEIAREYISNNLLVLVSDILNQLTDLLENVNRKIFEGKSSKEELHSMACVLSLAIVDIYQNQFYYAHIGDTRIYLFRDGALNKISRDQSFVGFLEDSGRLTEQEAMSHPKRNEINKALGFEKHIASVKDYIEVGKSPFLPGDTLLMCSDGLTDMVNKQGIASILNQVIPLQEKCEQLISAANTNGGKDNITVILVENSMERASQKAIMPQNNMTKRNDDNLPLNNNKKLTATEKPINSKTRHRKAALVIVITLACAVLATLLIWYFDNQNRHVKQISKKSISSDIGHSEFLQFRELIKHLKGDTLLLNETQFSRPILINDTFTIQRNNIFIKGVGNIIFIKDNAYGGPALVFSNKCKSILLEHLTFQNFKIAIVAPAALLKNKNLLFIKCGLEISGSLSNKVIVNGETKKDILSIDEASHVSKTK